MQAATFWKAVTVDRTDMLGDDLGFLRTRGVQICASGSVGVNASVESALTLEFDLLLAASDLERVEPILANASTAERFAHSVNLAKTCTDGPWCGVTGAEYRGGCSSRESLGDSRSVALKKGIHIGVAFLGQATRIPSAVAWRRLTSANKLKPKWHLVSRPWLARTIRIRLDHSA